MQFFVWMLGQGFQIYGWMFRSLLPPKVGSREPGVRGGGFKSIRTTYPKSGSGLCKLASLITGLSRGSSRGGVAPFSLLIGPSL